MGASLVIPNGARYITLQDTKNFANQFPAFPAKDPEEELNYALDFTSVIEGTIPLSDVEFGPIAGDVSLAISEYSVQGQVVVFRITGGEIGREGVINALAVFDDGQQYAAKAVIPIIEKIPPVFPEYGSFDFSRPADSSMLFFFL